MVSPDLSKEVHTLGAKASAQRKIIQPAITHRVHNKERDIESYKVAPNNLLGVLYRT